MSTIERRTVDLAAYPDLVVIYLGMRVNRVAGLKRLLRLGPQISRSVAERPAGLLLHENVIFGLVPLHLGMRQYWRDFESLETWARSLPHRTWWQEFLRDTGGTGFWHEIYFKRGGMEAIYDNLPTPIGFARFADTHPARGALFSARNRLGLSGESELPGPVREQDLAD
jgi:hypothetical protein